MVKKGLLVTSIVVFVVLALMAVRKAVNAQNIKIADTDVKFTKLNSVTDVFGSMPVKINLGLQNFGHSNYNITDSYIEVQTVKGKTIASQKTFINPTKLQKRSISNLGFDFEFDYTGLIALIQDNGISLKKAYKMVESFVKTKKLGTQIILKGWVMIDGVKLPVNLKLDI